MPNNCPFCPLEHRTDWYYQGFPPDMLYELIVCKDLNNREYKYRLLVVYNDFHRDHMAYQLSETRHQMRGIGMAVANAHISNGWAKEIAHVDTEHMKYPEHYHIQICLK